MKDSHNSSNLKLSQEMGDKLTPIKSKENRGVRTSLFLQLASWWMKKKSLAKSYNETDFDNDIPKFFNQAPVVKKKGALKKKGFGTLGG